MVLFFVLCWLWRTIGGTAQGGLEGFTYNEDEKCFHSGIASADWLLGLSETQSVDIEMRDICEKTGLSANALLNLIQYNKEQNKDGRPTSHKSATAAEKLWFINHLIDDVEITDMLVDNANMHVNMRNIVDNFAIPPYDGSSAIEITKLGLERLGMTFNFTQGKETADFYAFQCQQKFIEFIENIVMPAYFVKGWESDARQKEESMQGDTSDL